MFCNGVIILKTAILGGTFDPIHNAHLAVAKAALTRYNLQKVLLIPAAHPPHKLNQDRESFEHRYKMVELACAGIPGLEPSRLEESSGRSYSIDTIERLQNILPLDSSILFIIGADAFAEFTSWHRWEDVRKAVEFLVVSRPGHSYSVPSGAIVHRLESLDMAVSSSEIRQKLLNGEPTPDLPPAVETYIREHRLYCGKENNKRDLLL